MALIPPFSDQHLQAICDVLGDVSEGLAGSEISRLLAQCSIEDSGAGITKRKRLYNALSQQQRLDQCANKVIAFIQAAMDPARYVENPALFGLLRYRLNQVLSFAGYKLGEDGRLRQTTASRALSEAEHRARQLRLELQRRAVRPDVLRFCTVELLQEDYFHAILEATQSAADKIRQKTGLNSDGIDLVDDAFDLENGPKLAFNTLQTDSEQSEHTGLVILMKGAFGAFSDPTIYALESDWVMNEQTLWTC